MRESGHVFVGWGDDFASFCDFDLRFWNSSECVGFFSRLLLVLKITQFEVNKSEYYTCDLYAIYNGVFLNSKWWVYVIFRIRSITIISSYMLFLSNL
jgi:hypothetical protein